jgi:hypothetical protein
MEWTPPLKLNLRVSEVLLSLTFNKEERGMEVATLERDLANHVLKVHSVKGCLDETAFSDRIGLNYG